MSQTALAWIKLDINFLDNSKIKIIRKLPDGSSIVLLWVALMCEAMKSRTPGVLNLPTSMPKASYLSTIADIPESTVQLGLRVFDELSMLVQGDGFLEIPGFREHQAINQIEYRRELTRLKVAKSRARDAGLIDKSKEFEKKIADLKSNMLDGLVTVTPRLRNLQRNGYVTTQEESRGEEKKRRGDSHGAASVTITSWIEKWNAMAETAGLTKVQKDTTSRSKKISARLKADPDFVKHFDLALELIPQSRFLCGATGWCATFDWLIENDKNYVKVCEGNYDNRDSVPVTPGGTSDDALREILSEREGV